MPERADREAQINTKVSEDERDAIWAAVRQSRYKTISEAVREQLRAAGAAASDARDRLAAQRSTPTVPPTDRM